MIIYLRKESETMEGYSIRCSSHTYITLEYDDKFVFCLDNDMNYMEDIIEKIEKRTGMNINDIPRNKKY